MKLSDRFLLQLKNFANNPRNERVRTSLLQSIPFWVASLITGLVAVLYTKLFAKGELLLAWIIHRQEAWLFILTPIGFLLAYLIVDQFAPYAKGSGIPQLMASLELATPKNHHKTSRLLSLRIIVVKILSSMVMVISGGVIGREGPTIQIAGSIFRKINQWVPASWPKISRKNMIMTGGAAGLAAAFNTPLGGIVFAVEELTKTHISYFKTALFSAVIIAGLTAQALLGPYLYLGYPDLRHLDKYIFGAVLLVAIISGAGGAYMSKIILWLMNWKNTFAKRSYFMLYALLCGLILASLAYFVNLHVLGSGKEQMTTVLFTADKTVSWDLPLLRMAGSVISFTTGAAGGIFAPALSTGATIGGFIANLFQMSATDTNLLALVGMVGFLTGVTRSPFTSAILVLEMTDRHSVIFYLMLGAMLSSIACNLIEKHSLYEHLSKLYIADLTKED